jgi:hypothetical protein
VFSPLDSDLIGLHVDQIQLPLFHDRLMDSLAVLACPIPPLGYRSFVQPKGVHNRLHRTSIGQQGYHNDDEFHRLT